MCGLLIPNGIERKTHSLFFTIDHVVPLSNGGTDAIANRRAAHYFCNRRKAAQQLHEVDRNRLRKIIRGALRGEGMLPTEEEMTTAIRRCSERPDLYDLPITTQGATPAFMEPA